MHLGSFDPALALQCRLQGHLLEQLEALGAEDGVRLSHEQRLWASATFNGTRHVIAYVFDGPDAVKRGKQLLQALPEHEFAIPGHLVADAQVERLRERSDPPRLEADINLLILEEA